MYFCPGSTTKMALSSGAPRKRAGMVFRIAQPTTIAIMKIGTYSIGMRALVPVPIVRMMMIPATL